MALDNVLLAELRHTLYTAVVGDVLDRMGYRDNFLPPAIRPLDSAMVVLGRAVPVIVEDAPGTESDPFGRLLEALDALGEGDVYITNGGATPYSLWGELMSTRARHLKAAGAVMNGHHRDTDGVLALNFPTFSWGAYALDVAFRGRVVDYNVPSRIGGKLVRPGDIVFGDRDGVLVVAQEVAEEAFTRAHQKVSGENLARQALRDGVSAVEAFRRFGVM